MEKDKLIGITSIKNTVLYNLEDITRNFGYKSVKAALQVLSKDEVYQLTIRNGAVFDTLYFTTLGGLELLIRHSKIPAKFTDTDMFVKSVTPETPPYPFLNGIIRVIPTTLHINIEFSERGSSLSETSEVARLYSITEIAAEFEMTGKKLNKLLELEGVQRQKGNRWRLLKKYEKCGYVGFKPNNNSNMYWTKKGKAFICKIIDEKRICNEIND
ncbi:MAG TPA: phage antirepressor KilAC domain-containing protein [Ruminococcus sp.]|nr:phage antirepressor KilAC domain-containing protein [Ruminococcus sp.]